MGTASVAHQTAIRTPIEAVFQPLFESSSGAPMSIIRRASAGPRKSPTVWCVERPSIMVSVKAEVPHNVFCAGKPTFFDAVRRRFYIFGLDIVDYSP